MKAANPVGRPSKFTAERIAAILQCINDRIPYELAAQSNGITWQCLYRWMQEGCKDLEHKIDSEKAKFYEAIKRTEVKKIREHLENIHNNIERWQAQAWILERRWHKYFSPNAAVQEINQRLDEMELEMGIKKEMKDAVKKIA